MVDAYFKDGLYLTLTENPIILLKKQALNLQGYSPYGGLEPAIQFLEIFSPHVILRLFFG